MEPTIRVLNEMVTDPVIEQFLAAKARRRRELAALPIERKLEIVIELQESVAEIREAAGRAGPRPWDRSCLVSRQTSVERTTP